MNDESFGIQGMSEDDRTFNGSRFSEVRAAIFENPYQKVWGGPGEEPFPRRPATLGAAMRGALSAGMNWVLLDAARRTLISQADLRWGTDRKGFRRLLYPNGICLTGMWEITEDTPYTGSFAKGSRGLIVSRFSTFATETRRGFMRSMALVGRIYPTTDRHHPERLPTATFITQQDMGGEMTASINAVVLRNAPDTTMVRSGPAMGLLSATAAALKIANPRITIRQLYRIAELGKPEGQPTRSPEFMQLTVVPEQPVISGDGLDFRDEIMAQIYDRGDPQPKRKLVFRIETSDTGSTHGPPVLQRRTITNWRTIGTITYDEAVASVNGDRVIHFHHPPWRDDRNDPRTAHEARP